jgi:hypothetical protein
MAAKIADYILSGSEAKSKLVFIITDGEWNGSSEAGMEALYESWKKKGYKAFVICLANGLTHTDVSAVWHPVTNPYIISVPSWYECLVKNEMKNYCGFTLRDVILAVNSRELARSIGRRIVKEVVGTKRHQ